MTFLLVHQNRTTAFEERTANEHLELYWNQSPPKNEKILKIYLENYL